MGDRQSQIAPPPPGLQVVDRDNPPPGVEVNQENTIPDEQEQANTALQTNLEYADNKDEEIAKLNSAALLAQMLPDAGKDAQFYYDNMDSFKKSWTGKDNESNSSFFARIGNVWKAGNVNVQLGELRFKQLLGDNSPELQKQIDNLRAQLPPTDQIQRSIPEQFISAAANMAPTMLYGLKEGLGTGLVLGGGAAGVTALAGQAGPQLLAPEELVTVPSAFMGGLTVGMTAGSIKATFQLEAGLAYDELLDMKDANGKGLDPNIARAASLGIGAINGVIEYFQLKKIPGLENLFSSAAKSGIENIIKKNTLKNLVTKTLIEYGKNIGTETLQELAQESVNIAVGELAKEVSNSTGFSELPHATQQEIIGRLWQTAEESIKAFTVMGLPGTTGKVLGGLKTVEGKTEQIKTSQAVTGQEPTAPAFTTEQQQTEQTTPPGEQQSAEQVQEEAAPSVADMKEQDLTARISARVQAYQENIDYYNEVIKAYDENPASAGVFFPDVDINTEEGQQQAVTNINDARAFIEKLQAEKANLDQLLSDIQAGKQIEGADLKDLETFWQEVGNSREAREQQAIVDAILPKNGQELMAILGNWGAQFEKGDTKGLNRAWPSAAIKAAKGLPISEQHLNKLMKEIENNPRKFQMLFADMTKDEDAMRALDAIMKREAEEEKLLKASEEAARIKKVEDYKTRLKEATTMSGRLKLAREVKDPRVRLRILTGDYSVGEITGDQEVNTSIKKVPKAVQSALKEGKETGIKQEKTRKNALEADQKAKKKLKTYIRKLAKMITKPVGKSVDFYYRQAIETIQEGIDPNFRNNMTLDKREALRRVIKKSPEVEKALPASILEKLNQKPLNEFKVEELEELAKVVNRLKKQGRLKEKLKKAKYDRWFKSTRDAFVDRILKGQALKEVIGKGQATEKEGIGKKLLKAHLWNLRPNRIFDMLDGGKQFRGPIHELFYNKVNKMVDREYVESDKRMDRAKAKQKELGVKIKDFIKVREIDGVKYTVDEIMDIYAGFKNPLKRDAIIYGNSLSEDLAQKFISTLTEKERAWADFIISEYDQNYDRLRKAHIEYANEDLGSEKNYTPILRKDIDYESVEADMASELLERSNLKKAYANKSFTKSRLQNIPPELQKSIKLGLNSTWLGMVQKQEHYIQGAQTIKQLQRVANDKKFTAAIRQKYGKEAVKLVQDYVNRIANPNIYKNFDASNKVSKFLRKNTAVAYLAFNMGVAFKQLPSLFLYLQDAGPAHLMGGLFKMIFRPMKTIKEIHAMAPQVKHREIERFMAEIRDADKNAFDRILSKVGEAGFSLISAVDHAVVIAGWQGVYDRSIAKGLSKEDAIQQATNATLRTQQTSHAKDVAKIYSSNEVLNWLTMFSSQANQIYNMMTYDLPMYFKNKDIRSAIYSMAGLTASALLVWAISNRRPPEDDEDIKDALSDQSLGALPIIGSEINAARNGWMSSSIPGLDALKGIVRIPFYNEDETKIKKGLESLAVALGIPYIGVKKIINTFQKGDPGELIGTQKNKKKTKNYF